MLREGKKKVCPARLSVAGPGAPDSHRETCHPVDSTHGYFLISRVESNENEASVHCWMSISPSPSALQDSSWVRSLSALRSVNSGRADSAGTGEGVRERRVCSLCPAPRTYLGEEPPACLSVCLSVVPSIHLPTYPTLFLQVVTLLCSGVPGCKAKEAADLPYPCPSLKWKPTCENYIPFPGSKGKEDDTKHLSFRPHGSKSCSEAGRNTQFSK